MTHSYHTLTIGIMLVIGCQFAHAKDPLPSWRDGETKTALLAAITKYSTETPAADRIAVFDNDGTLWAEQPGYFQALFILDYLKQHVDKHPEWKTTEPFASALQGKLPHDHKPLLELVSATHSGNSVAAFQESVKTWLAKSSHPRFKRPYHRLVYQPKLELLAHLHAQGFQCWIVSGGGVDFMRCFASEAYGIPPERIIGSTGKTSVAEQDGKLVVMKEPGIRDINDKEGKVVNIHIRLGRQPVLAFGNSDGDLAMCRACVEAGGTAVLLHHDDAEREYAYDRDSSIGRLDKALDLAKSKGIAGNWILISMKKDFAKVFPDQ